MAAVQEMQRLLVRLTGDGTQYASMLKKAERQTKTYVDKSGRVHDALTRKFVSNTRKMQLQLNMLGQTMIMAGQKATAFGRTMSLRLTAPIVLLGTLAARSFAKFDSAMTQSIAIMDVTASQIERMTNLAREMSASGQALQGAEEIAESYFFLASAGLDAEQSMALMKQTMDFATAGMFDAATATDLATDAMSALGLMTDNTAQLQINYARVTDVLVKANTLANASVQQFATALTTKAGAAFKVYGKDIEEGVAVLAAFADQGVKAQLAGTALDRIMRLMSKGAIDNAKAHKALGFEVFDSTGKMRNLGNIIGNLENVLRGMSDEQRAVALDMLGFEARVQGVLLPLIGTSKAIKEYEKQLRSAGGMTKKVADEQMKSFSAQMKVVWNQIKDLVIEIGKRLAPAIKALGGVFGTLAGWLTKMPGWLKIVITALAALVAIIGPLLLVIGHLSVAIGLSITKITALGAKLGVSKMALLSWKTAWAGIIGLGILVFLDQMAKMTQRVREEIVRLNEEQQQAFEDDETMRRAKRTAARNRLGEISGEPLESGLEELLERAEKDRQIVVRRVIKQRKEIDRLAGMEGRTGVSSKAAEEFTPTGLGGWLNWGQSTGEQLRDTLKTTRENFKRDVVRSKALVEETRGYEEDLARVRKTLEDTKKGIGVSIDLKPAVKGFQRFAGTLQGVGRTTGMFGGHVGGAAQSLNSMMILGQRAQEKFYEGSIGSIFQNLSQGLGSTIAQATGGELASSIASGIARVVDPQLDWEKKRKKEQIRDFTGVGVARAGSAEMLSRIISAKVGGDPQERAADVLEDIRDNGVIIKNFDVEQMDLEAVGGLA